MGPAFWNSREILDQKRLKNQEILIRTIVESGFEFNLKAHLYGRIFFILFLKFLPFYCTFIPGAVSTFPICDTFS